jgi:hypothetical protein
MKKITVVVLMLFTALSYAQDIKLNGTVSAQNNQIKNVANPTEAQDAVTKAYVDGLIANLQSQIDGPNTSPESLQTLAFEPGNYVRFSNISEYENLQSMTIEFWTYLNSSPCTDESIIGTEYFASGWHFYPGLWAWINPIQNSNAHHSCEDWLTSGNWFHIALQYEHTLNENQWKLFINGVPVEQITGEVPVIGDGGDIVINRHTWDSGESSRLSGLIDEVRFSNIARYSDNFTPSTQQLQNDENTLLLLNFEDTSSTQVIDSSSYQNHGEVIGQINYVNR